jgi:hypothetical protein
MAVAVIAFVGAVIGVVGQQAVDVWKTSKAHRQELQRRIFDEKFKTAKEITVILYSAAASFRARLAAPKSGREVITVMRLWLCSSRLLNSQTRLFSTPLKNPNAHLL